MQHLVLLPQFFTESTLSFLGLGDASVPSGGQTLSEGYATGVLAPDSRTWDCDICYCIPIESCR